MEPVSAIHSGERTSTSIAAQSRTAVVVLGMHRSGTSALAGSLAAAGCAPPRTLMGADESNLRGHFESQLLCDIHDEMLSRIGSTWDDWREIGSEWFSSAEAKAFEDALVEAYLSEFDQQSTVVIKDPRMCRFVSLWRHVFERVDVEPAFVHVVRNPLEVARSLSARNGFSNDKSILVWARHVLDAERDTRGQRRVFIGYDSLISNPPATLRMISETLRLTYPKSPNTRSDFVSVDLRHHEVGRPESEHEFNVQSWASGIYEVFERWARNGEVGVDLDILDGYRDSFNLSSTLFSPSVVDLTDQAKALRDEIHALKGQVNEQQHRVTELQKCLEERDAVIAGLKNENADLVHQISLVINSRSWRLTAPLRNTRSLGQNSLDSLIRRGAL